MFFIKKSALLLIWLFFNFLSASTAFGQYEITLVDYETIVSVDNNLLSKKVSITYQIENEKSSWISDFELPYNDDNRFHIISAEIINSYGKTVRKLKKKDILVVNDQSRDTFYQDDLVKQFSLQWHEFPYRIKVNYELSTKDFLSICNWTPYTYSNIPVNNALLRVELPVGYEVNLDYPQNHPPDSVQIEDKVFLNWSFENLPYIEEESFAPNIYNLIPRVRISPHSFRFKSEGSFASWRDYGNWQFAINDELLELTEDEKTKVNELVRDIQSDYLKAQVLYYYLQDNTRYINVAIDEGGMIPYPASYVCNNKYGDCKALTIYMKALLNYVGIESYYTDVFGGIKPININEDHPSQQFNHVILCVPIEGDTLWLENTSNALPFNYSGAFTSDRPVLVIENDNSRIIRTSKSSKEQPVISNSDHNLNSDGSGFIRTNLKLRGRLYEKHRNRIKNFSRVSQEEYIRDKVLPPNSELISWSYPEVSRDSTFIELNIEYKKEHFYRQIAGRKIISLPKLPLPKFEKPEERKYPVQFNSAIHYIDTLTYKIPDNHSAQWSISETLKFESEFGFFILKKLPAGKNMQVYREIKIDRQLIPLEQYPGFYEFIKLITTANNNQNLTIFN